jgi:hypothetical protein
MAAGMSGPGIKTIYDKRTYASEWCKDLWYLTENANEMIFGVYQVALPHFFYPKKSGTLRTCCGDSFTLVFHNHFSQSWNKVWDLTGNLHINSRM